MKWLMFAYTIVCIGMMIRFCSLIAYDSGSISFWLRFGGWAMIAIMILSCVIEFMGKDKKENNGQDS